MKLDIYQAAMAVFTLVVIAFTALKMFEARQKAIIDKAKIDSDTEIKKAQENSSGITAVAKIIERVSRLEGDMNDCKQNYIRLLERMADKYSK